MNPSKPLISGLLDDNEDYCRRCGDIHKLDDLLNHEAWDLICQRCYDWITPNKGEGQT